MQRTGHSSRTMANLEVAGPALALASDSEATPVRAPSCERRREASAGAAEPASEKESLQYGVLGERTEARNGGSAAEAAPAGWAPLHVEVGNLLKNAGKRAEKAMKQARQSELRRERAAKKARTQAEALLSTEVLLDIARGRSDVGTIMCQHCARSIPLASALPALAPPPVKKRRNIRDGQVVIAPKRRRVAPEEETAQLAAQFSQLAAIEDGQVSPSHPGGACGTARNLDVARALQQATGATLSDEEFDSGEEKLTQSGLTRARRGPALFAWISASSRASGSEVARLRD